MLEASPSNCDMKNLEGTKFQIQNHKKIKCFQKIHNKRQKQDVMTY